jgi:hypothetical protein
MSDLAIFGMVSGALRAHQSNRGKSPKAGEPHAWRDGANDCAPRQPELITDQRCGAGSASCRETAMHCLMCCSHTYLSAENVNAADNRAAFHVGFDSEVVKFFEKTLQNH